MQILQRKYPTRLARPGSLEKREFEYIRHGTRALLTTFCVPTGQVVWNLGPTRTSVDWVRHLENVATQFPLMKRFDWVVDNLNTHWSRRFLKRGDFASAAAFEERIQSWLTTYNRDHAHPYRWTYTGEPLVRGTPFSQTRRQQRRGRAGFGTCPSLWVRKLYPPRPLQAQSHATGSELVKLSSRDASIDSPGHLRRIINPGRVESIATAVIAEFVSKRRKKRGLKAGIGGHPRNHQQGSPSHEARNDGSVNTEALGR